MQVFHCKWCGLPLRSQEGIDKHTELRHGGGKGVYCIECRKWCLNKQAVKAHYAASHLKRNESARGLHNALDCR